MLFLPPFPLDETCLCLQIPSLSFFKGPWCLRILLLSLLRIRLQAAHTLQSLQVTPAFPANANTPPNQGSPPLRLACFSKSAYSQLGVCRSPCQGGPKKLETEPGSWGHKSDFPAAIGEGLLETHLALFVGLVPEAQLIHVAFAAQLPEELLLLELASRGGALPLGQLCSQLSIPGGPAVTYPRAQGPPLGSVGVRFALLLPHPGLHGKRQSARQEVQPETPAQPSCPGAVIGTGAQGQMSCRVRPPPHPWLCPPCQLNFLQTDLTPFYLIPSHQPLSPKLEPTEPLYLGCPISQPQEAKFHWRK